MFLQGNALWWSAVLARSLIALTLFTGLMLLVRRGWRLTRFIAELKTMVQQGETAAPCPRLTRLCLELRIPQPPLFLATETPLAFCFGLFRPRIYLSTGLVNALSDTELKAVLLHEDHHRCRFDPLRTLLADLLATLFFFLPTVTEWRDQFVVAIELAADHHAMQLAGRFSLAGALHKLLTHPLAVGLPATGLGGINSLEATDVRLAQLLDDTPFTWHFSPRNLTLSNLALVLGCMILQYALF